MKKIFLSFLLILLFSTINAFATTYYACTGGGNWSSTSTWATSSNQTGGSCAVGPPIAGDTANLDSHSGNVTLTGAAAAATIDETGYTGTLAFGTQTLTLTAASSIGGAMTSTSGTISTGGNITLLSTPTGSFPTLSLTNSMTYTAGGFTWPGNVSISASKTMTTVGAAIISGNFSPANSAGAFSFSLGGNLTIGGTLLNWQNTTTTLWTGAFNVSVGTLQLLGGNQFQSNIVKYPAGQTLTVTTALILAGTGVPGQTFTFNSATASSSAFLNYTGTLANENIYNMTFTDIDASGSSVPIYNYNGGTLTRTKSISNVNATNFGVLQCIGGVTSSGGISIR